MKIKCIKIVNLLQKVFLRKLFKCTKKVTTKKNSGNKKTAERKIGAQPTPIRKKVTIPQKKQVPIKMPKDRLLTAEGWKRRLSS